MLLLCPLALGTDIMGLTAHACIFSCRYVTQGALQESGIFAGVEETELTDWQLLAKARYAVYKPGGPMAMELSKNPTVLVVNDTVFAHGGLLPTHGEQCNHVYLQTGKVHKHAEADATCRSSAAAWGRRHWLAATTLSHLDCVACLQWPMAWSDLMLMWQHGCVLTKQGQPPQLLLRSSPWGELLIRPCVMYPGAGN